MRTVQPAGLKKDSTPEKVNVKNEFILNLTIPFRLVKERLYLIKSLLGIDVFPGSHVVYNGIGNNFWSLN